MDSDLQARIAALTNGTNIWELDNQPDTESGDQTNSLVPLTAYAQNLIESLGQGDGIKLHLSEIDVRTRGFRAQDLVMIVGFSHSGKTQLTLNMILNNQDKRILFVTLDDPPEMILCKLIAMQTGWSADRIEEAVRAGDQAMIDLVRRSTAENFENLLLHDERITVEDLDRLVQIAEEQLGGPLDAVIIDYLDLLRGVQAEDEYAGTKKKADALKGWATKQAFPTICLHQGTRGGARPGSPITITSMAFSGEQQATIILGVRRKKDDPGLDPAERASVQDTVTLHVVKCKRPGGRTTSYGGVTYHLDPETGRIGPWRQARQVAEGYTQ